jgi:hypothetical protein
MDANGVERLCLNRQPTESQAQVRLAGACCRYRVLRIADQLEYALKHMDLRAMGPSERCDLVNEIR